MSILSGQTRFGRSSDGGPVGLGGKDAMNFMAFETFWSYSQGESVECQLTEKLPYMAGIGRRESGRSLMKT